MNNSYLKNFARFMLRSNKSYKFYKISFLFTGFGFLFLIGKNLSIKQEKKLIQ